MLSVPETAVERKRQKTVNGGFAAGAGFFPAVSIFSGSGWFVAVPSPGKRPQTHGALHVKHLSAGPLPRAFPFDRARITGSADFGMKLCFLLVWTLSRYNTSSKSPERVGARIAVEGYEVSRAFVKENGEAEEFREQFEQERRLEEWLAIQKKKLSVLESGRKAGEMDEKKRLDWIEDTRADIEKTEKRLLELKHAGGKKSQ